MGTPLPLAPIEDEWWLDLIGSSAAPNAPALAAAAISNLDLPCGLICNGADGTEEHPDGQAGGLLIGNGGDGWDSDTAGVAGGRGGNGGLLIGDGGNGGYGADAPYEAGAKTDATAGGDGGQAGLLFGNGGWGGEGGDDNNFLDSETADENDAFGAAGGKGGHGGYFGDGGVGGPGGGAFSTNGSATGGEGGEGGGAWFGDAGDGGIGGEADAAADGARPPAVRAVPAVRRLIGAAERGGDGGFANGDGSADATGGDGGAGGLASIGTGGLGGYGGAAETGDNAEVGGATDGTATGGKGGAGGSVKFGAGGGGGEGGPADGFGDAAAVGGDGGEGGSAELGQGGFGGGGGYGASKTGNATGGTGGAGGRATVAGNGGEGGLGGDADSIRQPRRLGLRRRDRRRRRQRRQRRRRRRSGGHGGRRRQCHDRRRRDRHRWQRGHRRIRRRRRFSRRKWRGRHAPSAGLATGFRVGVVDGILAARPAAETITRATYLGAVANRVDSFWVPDHLNQLFPRSLWKQKYCGATKLIPKLDADMEPWTMLGHIAARNRLGRLRLGVAVTDSGRRNPAVTAQAAATLHLLTRGRAILVSAPANAKETSPTELTGPSRSRGLRRRWPPSARYGIRAANSSTATRPISRCRTRYSICRPIAESGPEIWIGAHGPRMLRAAGRYGDAYFPSFPHRPVDYKQRLDVVRSAASDAGRIRCPSSRRCRCSPSPVAPARAVYEALDSELLRAFGLNASDELRSPRHAAPTGRGLHGRPGSAPARHGRANGLVPPG